MTQHGFARDKEFELVEQSKNHLTYLLEESKDTLEKYPEIAEILRPFAMYLNQDIIIRLNYLVDVEGKEPEEVAKNYLKGLGLIE